MSEEANIYILIQPMLSEIEDLPTPANLFTITDVFNAVHLTAKGKLDEHEFEAYVTKLLDLSEKQNKGLTPEQETTAIWITIRQENFDLVSMIVNKLGFKIHHGLDQEIAFTKWISTERNLIPPYSMFYVACGAILIKDDKLLMVQEKLGGAKGRYGLPGGRADLGETIPECVERELFEETNIKAKYRHILYFREQDKNMYGSVDIYFACMVDCEEEALQKMKLCSRQISDCRWVPLGELAAFAESHSHGTHRAIAQYLERLYKGGYEFSKETPHNTVFDELVGKDEVKRKFIAHLLGKEKP